MRVEHVKQMVGYAAAGGGRRFGRADIEAAVQLEGVAIDDFTVEDFGDAQRQVALSRRGRAGDHNQGPVCGCRSTSCHRNVCARPGFCEPRNGPHDLDILRVGNFAGLHEDNPGERPAG